MKNYKKNKDQQSFAYHCKQIRKTWLKFLDVLGKELYLYKLLDWLEEKLKRRHYIKQTVIEIKNENKDRIIKKIYKTDCYDVTTDRGFLLIFKESELKKHKKLKKYNVVAYGDSISELKNNLSKVKEELFVSESGEFEE